MGKYHTEDAKRLLPDAPPARLPEEALLARLKADKSYRRSTSLTRRLFYRPQRLFTTNAPSRLLPSKAVKELRYRMIALVTSFALLLGLVNVSPLGLFSLVKKAAAVTNGVGADYTWLLSHAGTELDPYEITSPEQLRSLALLVQNLPNADSTTDIIIDGITYRVGPGQADIRPNSITTFPLFPTETFPVEEPAAPEDTAPPVEEPLPSEEPPSSEETPPPTLPESTEPVPSPSDTPVPSGSEAPAPTEPTQPAPAPEEEHIPTVLPAGLSLGITTSVMPAPLSVTDELQTDTSADSISPDPSPSQGEVPSPSPSESDLPAPVPSESEVPTPAPSESDAPAPVPSQSEVPNPAPSESNVPAPAPSESTSPAPVPSESEAPIPSQSEEPSLPIPSESEAPAPEENLGNSLPITTMDVPYSLPVPVGLEHCYFKLTADLSLSNYSADSADGGSLLYWLPIGTLTGFTSDGTLTGTPFQGTFDGNGKTITSFYYAPDPATKSTNAGYGLFGYVGDKGTVKGLTIRTERPVENNPNETITIPWLLSVLRKVEGDKIVDVPSPLGNQDYAVGVLAAACAGRLENCTVSQADLSYEYSTAGAAAIAVGGVAGIVSGGTLTDCLFLGKLFTTNSSGSNQILSSIGGVAGLLSGATATLNQCASGADISIDNGTSTSEGGGVGGLYGYSAAAVTLERCFTTGAVRANHDGGGIAGRAKGILAFTDGFSTVAVGKRAPGNTALTASRTEGMGGLLGSSAAAGTTLTNVYFAGSLLEPQFGAIAGSVTANLIFDNVAVDGTQVPHALFRRSTVSPSALRNLSGIDALAPTTDTDPATQWIRSTDTAQPQLAWCQNPTAPPAVKALSDFAAKRWFTPTAEHAYSGTDGVYHLYRLKDAVTGGAPDTLGALSLDSSRTYFSPDKSTVLGGEYTASVTVDGVILPAIRSALTAVNQSEGNADLIDSSDTLLRFVSRTNQAPGGYVGSVYQFSDGVINADGTDIPTYDNTRLKYFFGTLKGGVGSAISGFGYASGASGLIDTACDATIKNFTLQNVTIGNVPLGTNTGYCGFAVGQIIRTNLTNVDIHGLTYLYDQATAANKQYESSQLDLGLIGRLNSFSNAKSSFKGCDLADLKINVRGERGNLKLRVGGLLGENLASVGYSIEQCSMSGSISLDFESSSGATGENAPYAGGLVGYDNSSNGTNASFKNSSVSADLRAYRVGGLMGRAKGAALTQCVFSGSIRTSDNSTGIGSASAGLVAYQEHYTAVTATQCAVFGNITANYYSGGLFGYFLKSGGVTITDSYANAIVSAAITTGTAGGLIAYLAPHGSSSSFVSKNSYFTGQILAPSTFGALIGQTIGTTPITLTNTHYDSTLTQKGISYAGSVSVTPTAPPVCGVAPNDPAWTALSADTAIWSYSGTDRHYPQLLWLTTANAPVSSASTYQLFDTPGFSSLYSFKPDDTFSTTLPAEIIDTPAPKPPATQNAFEETQTSGATTSYRITGAADEGLLKFTYNNILVDGNPLILSYTIAVKPFDYGEGTQAQPFIIYNLDQLLVFRGYINSAKNAKEVYYQISGKPGTAEEGKPTTIDMSGLDWRGSSSALAGQLDGFGSTLTGLTTTGWYDANNRWYAGLLGGLADGSSVKNLTITGASISSPSLTTGMSHAGGILSATAGGSTITNVQVQGIITADRDAHVGGLIGSTNGAVVVENCVANSVISGNGGNGADGAGAGGLIGTMSGSGDVTATISQCAAYGSLEDWGNLGGLVGRVISDGFNFKLLNSYSLSHFIETRSSSTTFCGGFVGNVEGVNPSSRTIIDSCYYGGENKISGSNRYLGGYVGGAKASGSGLLNSGRDYLTLNIKSSAYNSDSNSTTPATLFYNGRYNGRYAWPEASDGDGPPASDQDNIGTAWRGMSTSFSMSQGRDTRQGVMYDWDPNTWQFDDGLYPRLANTPISNELTFTHLAIHYTKAASTDRFANVFVRYAGAKLSTASSSLRVTRNGRMAVAIDSNTNTAAEITITIGEGASAATRMISIIPSVEPRGYRDASIYYANPDGMWEDKVWEVYTADALAGLSTIFSEDWEDQNGIPALYSTDLTGGTVALARDIDLGGTYDGMSDYMTWRAIGDDAHPFNITFDGKGHTIYNLTMNPFFQHQDGYYKTVTYENPTNLSQGLFGTIGGGTVKNLVLTTRNTLPANASFYSQPGIRAGMGTTAAGALCATLAGGTLESCLVSLPVYTLVTTPKDMSHADYIEDWSQVSYLGVGDSVPLGGLVGQVTGVSAISNCAYTGYVYSSAQIPRPGSDVPPPQTPSSGPAGGLVGKVTSTGSLTVTNSYASSYAEGGISGALVGQTLGGLSLLGTGYDRNAVGDTVPAVGSGTAAGSAPFTEVPGNMGADWMPDTPTGLYPLPRALSGSTDTLSARLRISLTPHARSTLSGHLNYPGATLSYSQVQPGVASTPGTVTIQGSNFAKNADGLTQLELVQGTGTRRVLVNLRCWYDDVTVIDGVRHYNISTAEELWELSQIVNGTIGNPGSSKVAHTHSPEGGHDDFSNAVISLNGNVDLSVLTDLTADSGTTPRMWSPIGVQTSFAGTFDGNGHSVSGMTLSAAGDQGLFGTVSGTVQHLLVTGAAMTVPADSAGTAAGLLAARLTPSGRLLYCGTSGRAMGDGSTLSLGGLVGHSQGIITGCFSTAELSLSSAAAGSYVGGLAGISAGSGAHIQTSYFTGFANAASAAQTGGIVGGNRDGSKVSGCYVSAYLVGQVVYHTAQGATESVYDGLHTGKGNGGVRQDGGKLTMTGNDWSANDGKYYPIPRSYSSVGENTPNLAGTPLAQAARLAAAIFSFSGNVSSNYGRFHLVTVGGMESGQQLQSSNSALLLVGGNEARTVAESSGDVVLRLGTLNVARQMDFLRPCWLTIPSELAVTYRFNWDDLIALSGSKPNPKYNTTNSSNAWSNSGTSHTLRTAADWNSFAAYVNGGGTTLGHTFTLDYDIDFLSGSIATVLVPFRGTFHGGNHTLKNFKASAPLFATVEKGAKVEFLSIQNGNVTTGATGTFYAALVAGINGGRIANVAAEQCSVKASQGSGGEIATFVGGLVGQNSGTLDTCYFYTSADSGLSQIAAYYPAGAVPTQLRMGGLAGQNSGTISGCYASVSLECRIGTDSSGNYAYFSALVGLNDGAIRYTYWKFPYSFTGETMLLTSYRSSDGTYVPGKELFMGNAPAELTARWLSADSYGGAYYIHGNQLKLYSFRLARYDLSSVFGSDTEQYLMLGLQFGAGDDMMAANAVCSWQNYLLPNFANLPLTSSLAVRLPLLSSKVTYRVSTAYVIRKNGTPALGPMGTAAITGSALGGYAVTDLGTDPTRVYLDIQLTIAPETSPWGVYRKDNTLT